VNDEIIQRAERLCYAVAGRDLGDTPLYVVRQSTLPDGQFARQHHYAITTPSLDLYLREYIRDYRGRGPCMLLNDLGMADDWDGEDLAYLVLTTTLHELAHILDRPALFADRSRVDPHKLLFESLVVADATKRPVRSDLPAYYGHDASFIRIAVHLCHRASLAGVHIAPTAICGGLRYGLSHASDYQEALGDEPMLCSGMLFRDIAATDPPLAFRILWATDFVEYHDCLRSQPLKGVSR
jgi:hypothetical protein